jgi:hypothetical protein
MAISDTTITATSELPVTDVDRCRGGDAPCRRTRVVE